VLSFTSENMMKEQLMSDLFKSSITCDPLKLDFEESVCVETEMEKNKDYSSCNSEPNDNGIETMDCEKTDKNGSKESSQPNLIDKTLDMGFSHADKDLGEKLDVQNISNDPISLAPSSPINLPKTTLIRKVSSPKLAPLKKKPAVPPKTKPKPIGYKVNVNNFTGCSSPRKSLSRSRRESGGMKENYIKRNINAVRVDSFRKVAADSKQAEFQQDGSPIKVAVLHQSNSNTLSRKDSAVNSIKKDEGDSKKRRSSLKQGDGVDKGRRRSSNSTKLASFSDRRKFFQQMQDNNRATSPRKFRPAPRLT